MKKGTRALLVTVGGGVLVFCLLAAFLGSLRNTRPTVVAAKPLPAGARLTADVLEVREIHASARLPNALSSVKEAEGQVLTIARAPGDQITADMLGDQAAVGIASQLEPGHRAVAVHVNSASGLLGVIRPGDRVAVVAIVGPQEANQETMYTALPETPVTGPEGIPGIPGTEPITSTLPSNPSPVAHVVVSGLRVLVVPQTFRYEEVLPEEDKSGLFTLARTTASAQEESVILLDVPVEPVEIAPGVRMSPAALLPLLDNRAKLHLLLEPQNDDGVKVTVGASLGDLYRAMLPASSSLPVAPVGGH
jgi:Flp pilus assembly protein CpaB